MFMLGEGGGFIVRVIKDSGDGDSSGTFFSFFYIII